MKIRTFQKEDWFLEDPIEPLDYTPNLDIAEHGVAITVEDEQGVVGCGGLIFWEDVAEVWVRLSSRVQSFNAIEAVCSGLDILKDSTDLPVICRCLEGFDKAHRLVKWLGFEPTGEKMEYEDKHYLMYRLPR